MRVGMNWTGFPWRKPPVGELGGHSSSQSLPTLALRLGDMASRISAPASFQDASRFASGWLQVGSSNPSLRLLACEVRGACGRDRFSLPAILPGGFEDEFAPRVGLICVTVALMKGRRPLDLFSAAGMQWAKWAPAWH